MVPRPSNKIAAAPAAGLAVAGGWMRVLVPPLDLPLGGWTRVLMPQYALVCQSETPQASAQTA